MKGQFFIIAAIIIVISLIMIRGLLGIYSTAEINMNENMMTDDRHLENIMGSYENIVGISSLQQNANYSMAQYLSNFSQYMRNNEDAKILWVSVFANGSDQTYSVNVGNYLQRKIDVNMTATSSSPSSDSLSLQDRSYGSKKFTVLATGTINFTVSYIVEGVLSQDTFQFSASNISSSSGFFDVSVISGGTKIGTKRMYQKIMD